MPRLRFMKEEKQKLNTKDAVIKDRNPKETGHLSISLLLLSIFKPISSSPTCQHIRADGTGGCSASENWTPEEGQGSHLSPKEQPGSWGWNGSQNKRKHGEGHLQGAWWEKRKDVTPLWVHLCQGRTLQVFTVTTHYTNRRLFHRSHIIWNFPDHCFRRVMCLYSVSEPCGCEKRRYFPPSGCSFAAKIMPVKNSLTDDKPRPFFCPLSPPRLVLDLSSIQMSNKASDLENYKDLFGSCETSPIDSKMKNNDLRIGPIWGL